MLNEMTREEVLDNAKKVAEHWGTRGEPIPERLMEGLALYGLREVTEKTWKLHNTTSSHDVLRGAFNRRDLVELVPA